MKKHTNNDASSRHVLSDRNEHKHQQANLDQGLGLIEGSEFVLDEVFEFEAPQYCDFVKEKSNYKSDPVEDSWFEQVHWAHESKERQIAQMEEAIRNLPSASSSSSSAPNAPKSFFLFSRGGFAARNNNSSNAGTTTTAAASKTSPSAAGLNNNVLSPSSVPSSQSASLSPTPITSSSISPSIFSHHNSINHNTHAAANLLSPPLSSFSSTSTSLSPQISSDAIITDIDDTKERRDSLLDLIEQHNRQLQQQQQQEHEERRDSLLELIEQHNRQLQHQPHNHNNTSPLSSSSSTSLSPTVTTLTTAATATTATTTTTAPKIASIIGTTTAAATAAKATTSVAPKTTATTATVPNILPPTTQHAPSVSHHLPKTETATVSPFDNIMNSLVTDFFNVDEDDDALMDGIYNLNFPGNSNKQHKTNNNNNSSSDTITHLNNNKVAQQHYQQVQLQQQQHTLPSYIHPQLPQPQPHQAPPALPPFARHQSRTSTTVSSTSLVPSMPVVEPITSLMDLPDTFFPVHTNVPVPVPSTASTAATTRSASLLQRSHSSNATLTKTTTGGGMLSGTSGAAKEHSNVPTAAHIYDDSNDDVFVVSHAAPSITLAKSVYGSSSSSTSSSSSSLASTKSHNNKVTKPTSSLSSTSSTLGSKPIATTTATTKKSGISLSTTAPTTATTSKGQPLQLINNTIHTREKEGTSSKTSKVSATATTSTTTATKKIKQADIMDDELAAMLAEHNKRFKPKSNYEPRKYSVKEVKMWEQMSGKKWHDCTTDEKEQANQWMEQQRALST